MTASVFFDLDGTLTDPKPGITECIRYALSGLGRTPPPNDELTWCIGPPMPQSLGRLLDTTDDALIARGLALYRERFGAVGLFENALYPGIPEAVAAVRAAGFATYVATSKPHVYATRIVEHFGLATLFDRVYGSELDLTRVDKADLIGYALAREGLDPARVVMIGDREHDMIGARRNGVRAIGVTYGYGSEAELRAHGAARLAHEPGDIPGLVGVVLGAPR
jgi:phosphoglycolate phosphatase